MGCLVGGLHRGPSLMRPLRWLLTSWLGDQEFVLSAAWWCGLERVQPGSASGTQAQEAWHRHTLKEWMQSLRVAIPDFLQRLGEFCEARLGQLLNPSGRQLLLDHPDEPWPDAALLDGEKLSRSRRTNAQGFHRPGLFSS